MTADTLASRRRAFDVAGCVVNELQARALVALLERGELEGTTYEAVRPPVAVALASVGEACPPPDGAEQVWGRAGTVPSRALGVIADDGRMWSIAPAGVTWPLGDPR